MFINGSTIAVPVVDRFEYSGDAHSRIAGLDARMLDPVVSAPMAWPTLASQADSSAGRTARKSCCLIQTDGEVSDKSLKEMGCTGRIL